MSHTFIRNRPTSDNVPAETPQSGTAVGRSDCKDRRYECCARHIDPFFNSLLGVIEEVVDRCYINIR